MKHLLALSLLLLLLGCQQDLPSEPENIVIDIPIDFNIGMWENLDEGQRSLSFLIETTKSSYCEEASISYSLDPDRNIVKFSLNSIEPESCEGSHTANSNILIGALENQSYNLQINLKEEIINIGTLEVGSSHYTIKHMDNPLGFRLNETRLERVPENTIWGYVTYEESQTSNAVADFFNALKIIATDREYNDGYYGHFNIEAGNQISFNHEIPGNYVEAFIYYYDGNNETIKTLLDAYRNNIDDLELKVFNHLGQEF